MNISIFGLGRIGAVSAACLARAGHTVIGIDIDPAVLAAIRSGLSPVREPGVEPLIAQAVAAGRLTVTNDPAEALAATDISLVCAGTPSDAEGAVDLSALETVMRGIGAALREKPGGHIVAIRSTVPPGTTRRVLTPLLAEASGKTPGGGFDLVFSPEFLREGSGVADFEAPTRLVAGAVNEAAARQVLALHGETGARAFVTSPETAELCKYADNAWHALKVVFGNEMAAVARSTGVDGRGLMEILVEDRRLNISPAYLRPGFAFGGSCLPKDVRALARLARDGGVAAPLLANVMSGNEAQIERGADWIMGFGKIRVGLLGLSFKPGVDDLRESPFVALAERLRQRGAEVRSQGAGGAAEIFGWAELLVVTSEEFAPLLAQTPFDGPVLDLSFGGLRDPRAIPLP